MGGFKKNITALTNKMYRNERLVRRFFFINDFHNYMIQNAVNARQIVFIRG